MAQEKISIPDEHVEAIKNHHVLEQMLDIEMEISKAKYETAIKAYDKKAAFEAKQEGRKALLESKKCHEEMWALIGEAVPATKEGRWTVDTEEWTLQKSGRHNSSEGIGSILGKLAEMSQEAVS